MTYAIETKFELGQIVYVLYNNKIIEALIKEINISSNILDALVITDIKYYLMLNDYTLSNIGYYKESDIFDTKGELINNL